MRQEEDCSFFFSSYSSGTKADATFCPERWNYLQSQVAMWKLSLRTGFLPVFFCKGLQYVHKSGEGLSALASEFHTSARKVPESCRSSSQEKCVLAAVWLTCKALVCCPMHLSPLTDKQFFCQLAVMNHTPELAKTGTYPLNSSTAAGVEVVVPLWSLWVLHYWSPVCKWSRNWGKKDYFYYNLPYNFPLSSSSPAQGIIGNLEVATTSSQKVSPTSHQVKVRPNSLTSQRNCSPPYFDYWLETAEDSNLYTFSTFTCLHK